jgi:hypothetical protein
MASLSTARSKKQEDDGKALAHFGAISAPRAWTWKAVVPSTQDLQLTDAQYRLAARHNLGLHPGFGQPAECPNCERHASLEADPWHFLSCPKESKGEVTMRHNAVADALYTTVLAVGGQAIREPTGLSAKSRVRPDLRIAVGGHHILSDVAVVHPGAPSRIANRMSTATLGAARAEQHDKHRKYDIVAAAHQMEMLPFVVETHGGMAADAVTLMFVIAQAGEEQLGQWPKEDVLDQIASAVAIAIQRGNAMTYFSGHSRATLAGLRREQQKRVLGEATEERVEENEDEEDEDAEDEDAAHDQSGEGRAAMTA